MGRQRHIRKHRRIFKALKTVAPNAVDTSVEAEALFARMPAKARASQRLQFRDRLQQEIEDKRAETN